jgi:hypothetical protein
MKRKKCVRFVLLLTVMWLFSSLAVAEPHNELEVVEPDVDKSINFLSKVMSAEVGNYNIMQFNSHDDKIVFSFDTGDSWPAQASPLGGLDRLDKVLLAEWPALVGVTDPNIVAIFEVPEKSNGTPCDEQASAPDAEGYTRCFVLDSSGDYITSGDQSLIYKIFDDEAGVTAKITFPAADVYGVGFSVNRLQSPLTVKVFDSSDAQLGTTYVVAANNPGGTSHSFFGYCNNFAAEVSYVELSHSGAQFGMDDFVIAYGPSDTPCKGVALDGDVNEDCFVNIEDVADMLSNWLAGTL